MATSTPHTQSERVLGAQSNARLPSSASKLQVYFTDATTIGCYYHALPLQVSLPESPSIIQIHTTFISPPQHFSDVRLLFVIIVSCLCVDM